jgi:hypothetical protein
MCTTLPMARYCCEPHGASSRTLTGTELFWTPGPAAAKLLRAIVGWQMRRLERRLAQFQPDDHLLN